jgi:hypothetical protein
MKRTSIAMIFMLLLTACGSTSGGTTISDPPTSGSGSNGSGTSGSGTTGSGTSGSGTTGSGTTGSGTTGSGTTGSGTTGSGTTGSGTTGSGTTGSGTTGSGTTGYYTVSGRVVHRDTGKPYPRAYVRFGWLVSAVYEQETHTLTDGRGRFAIQLPAGQYQVTAGDACDLNAGFSIVGKAYDDVMITVPGTSKVDFVEYPLTPEAMPGVC